MYILNIETATKNCSVSVAKDGQIVAIREVAEQGYSHAEKLHLLIEEILRESGLLFQDLNAIAISRGPGSYTGLRIGVSAAKGLSYALEIPMISVDTLQVLASQVKIESGVIIPILDARRMEVYSAIYNPQHEILREVKAEIIDEDSFSDLHGDVYFVGDAVQKCKPLLSKPNFHFIEDVIFPSSNEMATLSHDLFLKKEFVDTAYFEPYYLKDFLIIPPKK